MKNFLVISMLVSSLAGAFSAYAGEIEVNVHAIGVGSTCYGAPLQLGVQRAMRDLAINAAKKCQEEGGALGDMIPSTLSVNRNAGLMLECGGVFSDALFVCMKR